MTTTKVHAIERKIYFAVALATMAMGWAGCADNHNSPPSYKEPVAPTIPQPNTNPSLVPGRVPVAPSPSPPDLSI